MATPTFAEVSARLTAHVRIVDTEWKNSAINSPSIVSAIDTAVQAAEGDFVGTYVRTLDSSRRAVSNALQTMMAGFDPILRDMGKAISSPYTDPLLILQDLRQYCEDNSYVYLYRNFTRGAASAGGSNVGTGTIIRNDKDEFDNAIQSGLGYSSGSFVFRLECVADARSGRGRGNEQFSVFTTGEIADDQLEEGASGGPVLLDAVCADDVTLITNANFATYNSTSGFQASGWLAANTPATGVTQNTTSALAHRPIRNNSTPIASSDTYSSVVMASGADPLYQYLRNINPDIPYLIGFWYKHSGTISAGTAKLTVGSVSITKAASTSWTFVRIDETNEDYAWPSTWLANGAKIQIERDGESAETMYIGGVIAVPYDFVNGAMLKILAGATDFVAGSSINIADYFTITDATDATVGTTVYWIDRVYGVSLPADSLATNSGGIDLRDYS